ncbi:MAG: MFS transporter [Planctomycetota bacterium]
MVAVAAGAFFVSAPGQSYSVAAFKGPMRDALGLSETTFASAYTLATLVSGMLLPVVGGLLDRHGASRLLPVLTVLLGAACCGMAGIGGLATLCVGLCCVRSLGQGAMTLSGNWLVAEWFDRRRATATAIAGLGGGLSVLCMPVLNEQIISAAGWRAAWVVLAAGVWLLMLAPSLLAVIDRPEERGLLPDGQSPGEAAAGKSVADAPSVAEDLMPGAATSPPTAVPLAKKTEGPGSKAPSSAAMRISGVLLRPTFWLLLAPVAATGMIVTGLVFHCVSLLGQRGLSSSAALALVSAQAVVTLALTPAAGWVTDRVGPQPVLVAAMACLAAGPLLLLAAQQRLALALYVAVLGAAESVSRTAGVTVWLDYYGRRGQGVVRGWAMAGVIFGAAIGPLPLAVAYDATGGYTPALVAFAAVAAAAGVAVAAAPPVSKASALA